MLFRSKGISASTATFHAFIPERLFAAGRANGVDVTGENCLGYRTYVQLTGSTNGFFKLNSPPSAAFADANFDSDGDGTPDAIWRFKIANSTWSRQVMGFGKAESASAPLITIPPASLSVCPGSNATFSVTASGPAPLSYQWLRNGIPLPTANSSSLGFTATNRAAAGSYAVVVTNAYGSITSSPALLRVLVPQRLRAPERLADGRVQLRFGDQDGGPLGAGDAAGFEVYATTNLFNTNAWVRLTNSLSLSNGLLHLEEPAAAGLPRRFYRVLER